MIGSWSPASCQPHHFKISFARGPVVPTALRAHCRLLWICLGLLLLATASAAQVSDNRTPDAKPLADQEPITPIPPPPAADPRKLALGERLFGDPRLSGDGKLACSSCHDLRTNGAGGGRTMTARDGSNAPFDTLTVFNAALSFRLNWEGNFRALAAQAESSLENPANMRTSVDEVVGKLNADPEMVRQFRAAYGRAPDRSSFLDALVTFEESLLTPGSRFDRWLGGDTSALSTEELDGYQLFKSLGCSSCHQGANVGAICSSGRAYSARSSRQSRRSCGYRACAMSRRRRPIFTTAAHRPLTRPCAKWPQRSWIERCPPRKSMPSSPSCAR